MTPRALWIPFEVNDLDEAVRLYTDHLGLSQVDGMRGPAGAQAMVWSER